MRQKFDTPEAESLDETQQSTGSSIRPKVEAYRGRVLVVDDSREAREVTAAVLRFHGFDVVEAQGGEEALAFYRTLHAAIDAVVLDMQMPGMDGSRTFLELRRVNPAVKVVICSGGFPESMLDHGLRRQALGWLAKPYVPDELIALLALVQDDRSAR